MFNLSDTIAAICTPKGIGGMSAIRISGDYSWNIIKKIFASPQNKEYSLKHLQGLYGYLKDGEHIIDEVVILPFKSPTSFTTEDVIEIFCHGGMKITSMILELCLKKGARLASPGEFTFRAFVNGRIDLTEAEAINEIVHAESAKTIYGVSEILKGSLRDKISCFRSVLLDLITTIESSIEFPMDVGSLDKEKVIFELDTLGNELQKLIQGSESGQIFRNGVKVSIVGPPNVGKSSILNQLLENQRAIVTDEPGTTRDTIEEKIFIDGVPIVIVDTAGIRLKNSINEAEKLGIERSWYALKNSDIAIVVADATNLNNKNTKEFFNLLKDKSKILVGNKMDLIESEANGKKNIGVLPEIMISAKYGTNIDKLKIILLEKIKSLKDISTEKSMFINERQRELLIQCYSALNFAISISKNNEPEDLIADELKKTVSKLDEITGTKINEEIISNIFAKFCIGK